MFQTVKKGGDENVKRMLLSIQSEQRKRVLRDKVASDGTVIPQKHLDRVAKVEEEYQKSLKVDDSGR